MVIPKRYTAHSLTNHELQLSTMTRLLVFFSAFAFLMFATPVLYAADQQVSIDFSQSENYVGANEPLTRMKPSIVSLAYGITFDRLYGFNVSFWSGKDQVTYPENDYVLEQDSSGGSLSASWYLDKWSLNAAISRSKTENTLTSPKRTAQADQLQKYSELYVSADYIFRLGSLDLRPELGLGFQKGESESRLNVKISNLKQLDTERQQDKGRYLQFGLSLAYWLEQGGEWLWQPGFDIVWFNPVSGTSNIATQRSVRNGRFEGTISNTREEDDESDASGYAELSLSAYIDEISITGYYSHSFDSQPNTKTLGVSAGFSF